MSAEDERPRKPPARTQQQRLVALAQANRVRIARAELKREISAGSVRLSDVILSPPDYVETAKVFELLLTMPQVGPAKAHRILNGCVIAERKTIGGLSERQRRVLIALLDGTGWPGRS
jgi:hypothetical protein